MFEAENLKPLKTIRDYLRYAYSCFRKAELFFGHGTDNAWDEALHLVYGVLSLPWDADKELLDAALTADERFQLREALRRRVQDREPVAYILGEAWFMGLPFKISKDVLIPRSPLAEMINDQCRPWVEESPGRILDLCCGSGCIGIAAAYAFPEAEIVLSDISEEALSLARLNVEKHGLEDRVEVVQSDLMDDIHGTFDLILSNPPYVDAQDMATLPPEFHHEPRLGLESGEDGLDATRGILLQASEKLNDNGWLICEVGNSLEALFQQFPEVLFMCPEFEHGGEGVFVISTTELQAHRERFESALETSTR